MFRLMSIATLVMILVCFFVGAGIALADDSRVPANDPANDNVPAGSATADVYDFSDYIREYATQAGQRPAPVDGQAVEEPETLRFDAMDC